MWSVSPKLSHSGEDIDVSIRPDCLVDYAARSNVGQLKYVVDGSEECWNEVESITEKFRKTGIGWDVWIMPVGATQEQQEDVQEDICQQTVSRGFNFSPRVHNWIFGNRVGT